MKLRGKFLHLFDTFEGLPKPGAFDGMLQKKQYLAPLKIAKAYLKKYKNVVFIKAFSRVPAEQSWGKIRFCTFGC